MLAEGPGVARGIFLNRKKKCLAFFTPGAPMIFLKKCQPIRPAVRPAIYIYETLTILHSRTYKTVK